MSGDLLTMLRPNDLPPRWDGHAVVWEPWETPRAREVFVCPPPKTTHACDQCGSTSPSLEAKGWVATSSLVTHDQIARRAAQIDLIARAAPAGTAVPRRLAFARLYAWRCPDCMQDVVWDTDTDKMCDLEPADYEDGGAWES